MLATWRLLAVKLSAGLAVAAVITLPASVGMAADLISPLFGQADVQPVVEPAGAPAEPDAAAVECMAKVVIHEAANQPYDGKVAVAQTLVNRLAAGRFGNSICDVAGQRGQFFNLAAFNPARDGQRWAQAVEVARAVLSGAEDAVAPGAMFFRAAYAPASTFFRSRQRVASVGAHIFYR